jgi:hypothetical protein
MNGTVKFRLVKNDVFLWLVAARLRNRYVDSQAGLGYNNTALCNIATNGF